MGFKKTVVVMALAFWAGTHYSPKFYEEVEKREEDLDDRLYIDETDAEYDLRTSGDGAWSKWAKKFDYVTNDVVRKKLLEFFPGDDLERADKQAPLQQSEADKLYRFAFDKGWKSASEDKANVAKQYQKLFGDVTAEEVQSEMRGG